jgi:hypothetical protein
MMTPVSVLMWFPGCIQGLLTVMEVASPLFLFLLSLHLFLVHFLFPLLFFLLLDC